jgi:two-component system CheB/CheR fusion protein
VDRTDGGIQTDKGRTDLKNKPTHDAGRADETAATTKEACAADDATTGVPVVALGGSAGALEPFNQFFAGMPADSGAAFVVIQHLSPTHESLLPELLARHTRMRVVQAQDGVPVEPNCVYVIPPNRDLGIRDGVLYLAEPVKQRGIPMPIDFFLRALAEDRQERAVCILLSGAGSDGTMGVRAIRGAGGLTMAQDPQTAQYGDLPRSAIATKLVDRVLQPEQMPDVVVGYLQNPYVKGGKSEAALTVGEGNPGGLDEILAIVRNRTDCDFRCYKKHTILRRIERRMGLRHMADIAQYSKVLGQDAAEVSQLFKDLLINVTAFFRDAEAFEELRDKVIAPLLAAKPADEPLRVWVTGCSTGEEAYSLAILLQEEMAAARKNLPLQVFATDIDEEALQVARQGFYPDSIMADMDPARLAKFFIRKEQGWQIVDSLRSSVVFAVQNLISDPPFSRMDLISCRNLLIYLDADTQTKLVPLFHFALVPGGYLFLGKSEGVGGPNDLFSQVSKKAKIFRRSTALRPVVLDSPIMPGKKKVIPVPGAPAKPTSATYADAIRQALLGHFMASVVLVGTRGQILQFHGQTGKYLDLPASDPNLNLLDIAKEGLSLRLRSALHAANDEKKTVVMDGVPITRDAAGPCARVTVAPVAQRGAAEPLLAVIFEDVSRPAIVGIELPRGHASETSVRQLEDELRLTQQDLQANIEELQASNEEMRVSNEEVVSANEELQSTNEELETSKEELQSVNEELTTVNSQLQEKVEQLDAAYGDMANLLKSTQIATLFLDQQLRIKFFTPATTQVLKLISSDTGRPVSDLSISFTDYDLTADARAVAQGGANIERDVRHADGSYYVVRFMPCRTQQDRLDGVVVTFDNVTRLRLATEHERFLADVVETAHMAFGVGAPDGRLLTFNQAFADLTGYSREELLQRQFTWATELTPAEWRAPENAQLAEAVRTRRPVRYEKEYLRKDGTRVPVELFVQPIFDAAGNLLYYRSFLTDIRARKQLEMERRQAEEQYRNLFTTMIEGFCIIEVIFDAHDKPIDYRFLEVNPAFEKQTGLHDAQGKLMRTLTPDHESLWFEIYGKIVLTGEPARFENEARALNRWYEVSAYRLGGQESRKVAIVFNDISERKQNEDDLRKLNRTLQALSQSDRAFLHSESEKDYLDNVCRIIAQDCGYVMVWIGYAAEDADKTVQPVASAGFEEGYLQTLHVTWADSERGRGPTGTAIRTGKPCVCANMLTDPLFAPWRADALARGYAASLVLPLLSNAPAGAAAGGVGHAFGAITIYSSKPDAFIPEEVELLRSLADDLSHGLEILRLRAANQRANDELKKNEATLKGIFDAARESIWLFGADGVILMGNETAFSRIGRPGSEIVGKKFSELLPLDIARSRLLKLQEVVQSARPLEFEDARNGMQFQHTFYPVPDAGGRVTAAVCFSRDITARKQAEEALRASERQERQRAEELAVLFEAVPAPVFISRDTDCLHLTGNRLADEILRIPHGGELSMSAPAEARPVHFRVFKDGRELRLDELPAQRAARGEHVKDLEITLVFDDGMIRHVLGYGTPLLDGQGRPRGAVAILVDITEHKRIETELIENQERLQLALASSEMATFEWDIAQDKHTWSENVHHLLGTTPATFTGKTEEFLQVIHPEDRSTAQANIDRALATGVYENEYRAVWPDGAIHHIAARGKVHCDREGRPVRMAGVCWDITTHKQIENALRFLGQCGTTGEGFFPDLARYLAQTLAMDFVCIDRLDEDRLSAQTLAMFHNGRFEDNVSYALKDTPCGDVVGKRICSFPRNVRALFAKDAVLQDLQAESYLGTTLWSSQGKPIGLIAVIGRRPLEDTRLGEAILQLVAVRAAGELERLQAEEQLRAGEERLRLAQEAANIEVWDFDPRLGVMQCTPNLKSWWGLSPEQTYTYDTWLTRLHPEDRDAAVAEVNRSMDSGGAGRQDVEYRVVAPDGSVRWVSVRAQTYFAGEASRRQAVRIIGTMQDVTKRRMAEEELRRRADELSRFNRAMVDRELRMIDLKKEVNELCARLNQGKRYPLAFEKTHETDNDP